MKNEQNHCPATVSRCLSLILLEHCQTKWNTVFPWSLGCLF